MLKVALIAVALTAAPQVGATTADAVMLAASAPEAGGMPGAPVNGADWTPLPPSRNAGLDFKDAATEPASAPPPGTGDEAGRRVVPALLALGALVVLLRKRPT